MWAGRDTTRKTPLEKTTDKHDLSHLAFSVFAETIKTALNTYSTVLSAENRDLKDSSSRQHKS